jgi:hypothetical protein
MIWYVVCARNHLAGGDCDWLDGARLASDRDHAERGQCPECEAQLVAIPREGRRSLARRFELEFRRRGLPFLS